MHVYCVINVGVLCVLRTVDSSHFVSQCLLFTLCLSSCPCFCCYSMPCWVCLAILQDVYMLWVLVLSNAFELEHVYFSLYLVTNVQHCFGFCSEQFWIFIYIITKLFSNFWINQPEPWEAVRISHKYKFLYLKTYEYANTFSMWQRGSQKVARKSVQYPVFMIVKYGIVLDICHSSKFFGHSTWSWSWWLHQLGPCLGINVDGKTGRALNVESRWGIEIPPPTLQTPLPLWGCSSQKQFW